MYKALLVDDNVTFRHMIRDMVLARCPSIQLVETANADEALRDINQKCPDLILMDIRLPEPNGLGLIRKIKNLCPHIIVIILAAYDSPEYRETVFEDGADFFLVRESTKTDTIFRLIETIVEKHTSVACAAHVVKCWYCGGEFDILSAAWCGCGVRADRPSKACPYCLRCICSHPDYNNEALWGRVSKSMEGYGFDRLFYLYL
jgi:CheY-like chemotaxis protein